MSKRFGRNQKRRMRQELLAERERSTATIDWLKDEVDRLRLSLLSLCYKKKRINPFEVDMARSLETVCPPAEIRMKVLDMREFTMSTVVDISSLLDINSGGRYPTYAKDHVINELCGHLKKHIKIEEKVIQETGDIIIYASIIAEENKYAS